jgi:hypothetical protein
MGEDRSGTRKSLQPFTLVDAIVGEYARPEPHRELVGLFDVSEIAASNNAVVKSQCELTRGFEISVTIRVGLGNSLKDRNPHVV